MTKTVMVVMRDIATTQALAPIVQILNQQGYRVHVFAEDIAAKLLPEKYRITCQTPQQLSHDVINQLQPDLMLTGTSVQPGLEKEAIRLARFHKIPSIAFVDTWTNYDARFKDTKTDEPLVFVPDYIATFDEISKQELAQLGIPLSNIIVTGNPHLANVDFSDLPTQDLRTNLQIPDKDFLIMFVSEPLPDKWYAEYGYNIPMEDEIYTTVQTIANMMHPKCHLVVKLHPIEQESQIHSAMLKLNSNIQIIKDINPYHLAKESDLILGLGSNLLIETALAGCPTYSILLQAFESDIRRSIGERFTFIPILRTEADIQQVISQLPLNDFTPPLNILHKHSKAYFLDLINKVVS